MRRYGFRKYVNYAKEKDMKWMKTVCIAVSLGTVSAGLAQAAPTIEKPVVLEEAMLSIAVPDLHGLIDGIGSVAAQVSPMMNGMMLKNMLGMQLGDPGLAGIAPGKGLAVVALDPTNAFAVIEVGEAQLPAYTNALAPQGILSKYENGLLVIGQTEEQVAKGLGLAKTVQNTLLTKRSPTLRIATRPANLIERNDEQIQGMLKMMPMLMGQSMMKSPEATLESTQTTLKFLEGEMRVFLSLASQCETVEVVLAPKDGSVRFSETFVPKAGTRLAALGGAPVLNQPNPRIKAGYLGNGAMRVDATLANPEALENFIIAEIEQLSKEMDLSDMDIAGLVGIKDKFWKVSGGSFSEMVGFGGESGMGVSYLMDVKDEDEALAAIEAMVRDSAPLTTLYKDLGIPLSIEFKENAREYQGVKIHQLLVAMSMTNQPPEVAEQLASMNLTNLVYDLAITDGLMVGTMGREKLETILDRLNDKSFKPAPLAARGAYPAGGFYYFDLDTGKYMEFALELMPDGAADPMMRQMGVLLQEVEPVTSAGFKTDGRIMWSLNVPGELIAKIGQIALMMQMQQGGGTSQP